jgi:23S rRNA (pseudouridine1915-N3)-methyltransferase
MLLTKHLTRGVPMRWTLAAIGRLKAGPERDLVARYQERVTKSGRAQGITRFDVREFDESRAARAEDRKAEEAGLLLSAIGADAVVIALDETGLTPTSPQFADRLSAFKNQGRGEIGFLIGGPDGHGEAVRARADMRLAFGALTWPHQLVRVMITEQLYRVLTLWAGHPYHRV